MTYVKPPAGKILKKLAVTGASIEELCKKVKKTVIVKISSPSVQGWVMFDERRNPIAASLHDETGKNSLEALNTILEILGSGTRLDVEIREIGKEEAKLFVSMFSQTLIESGDVKASILAAKTSKAVNEVSTSRLSVKDFEEEDDDVQKVQKIHEVPAETQPELSAEDHETPAEVQTEAKRIHNVPAEPPETPKIAKAEKYMVENFAEYLASLKGFTGIATGRSGGLELTAFLKNGEIIGAIAKDEGVEIKGLAALYYFEVPAEIVVEEGDFEVPEDVWCEEDRDATKALYFSLDK